MTEAGRSGRGRQILTCRQPPQVRALSDYTETSGIILAFLSQIDRTFDPERKRLPDLGDIRLPNRVDLGLFTKALFLHDGEARFQKVA